MKAIILSAGQGSRLGPLVQDKPKCLIDFHGRNLLDRQLDTVEANGVAEAVVVTGFRDDLVEEALARRSGGPAVRTIFNPFYMVADNTGSLFMARKELAGDCLVWNGDTLVSRELMRGLLANGRPGDGQRRVHRPARLPRWRRRAVPRSHRSSHPHARGYDHLVFARHSPHRAAVRGVDAGHPRRGMGEVDFPPDVEAARELTGQWDAAENAAAA